MIGGEDRFIRTGFLISMLAFFTGATLAGTMVKLGSPILGVLFSNLIVIIALILTALAYSNGSARIFFCDNMQIGIPKINDFANAFIAELIVLPCIVALNILIEYFCMANGIEVKQTQFYKLYSQSGEAGRAVMALLAVLAAPISEEIIFRNVFFRLLMKIGAPGIFTAALISSAFFAFIHFDAFSFASLFCLGIAFQILCVKTGNINSTIIMHSLHNSISILAISL